MCSTVGADRQFHIQQSVVQLFGETVRGLCRTEHEAEMYRYDSIKLMLAWEMCCRFFSPSSTPIRIY